MHARPPYTRGTSAIDDRACNGSAATGLRASLKLRLVDEAEIGRALQLHGLREAPAQERRRALERAERRALRTAARRGEVHARVPAVGREDDGRDAHAVELRIRDVVAQDRRQL